MTRLDRYLLVSFIKVFIPTLIVSIFFLMMQLLWKYIDDLAGRGIEWYYILELMFFWSAAVVPMALPIAVLLSSIMTIGNLSEYYELAAMKSAGISLYRIIRPLIILMVVIAIGMFFFSNNVIPVANFKGENLLVNIARQKPAFNLTPGVFYMGIDGYAIKVSDKEDNRIEDILIYDHSKKRGNTQVITAAHGEMNLVEDEGWLEFLLFDGYSYEELEPQKREDREKVPFIKAHFEESVIRISMESLSTGDLSATSRRRNYNMLNVEQLVVAYDSLGEVQKERRDQFGETMEKKYWHEEVRIDSVMPLPANIELLENIPLSFRKRSIDNALRIARSNKEFLNQENRRYKWAFEIMARHMMEFHKKFAVSIACIILFFIGAPFGAIIRKGGIGLPLVVSVIIFLIYHILITIFYKMGRQLELDPATAIWLPSAILLPVGIFLTVKAARDSSILDAESYLRPFRWFARRFKRSRTDEAITDPDQ